MASTSIRPARRRVEGDQERAATSIREVRLRVADGDGAPRLVPSLVLEGRLYRVEPDGPGPRSRYWHLSADAG